MRSKTRNSAARHMAETAIAAEFLFADKAHRLIWLA